MNARILLKEWKKKQRKAQWHYLVEPTPKNLTRFGPESLQNIFNRIKIPKNIHVRISKLRRHRLPGKTGERNYPDRLSILG